MDRKQKERLRFYLKARKRADKVLAKRREAERKKLESCQRKEANQELIKQYTQDLNALAQESGILAMVEKAAAVRKGSLSQEVCCYVDYGLNSSSLEQAIMDSNRGKLRASHLALTITWESTGGLNEAEVRVHKNGQITFHHNPLPIFPFLWRKYPHLLQRMIDGALHHPRPALLPAKKQSP